MSSTCPVCKLKCSRKDVMLRHKRNKHGTTHPYPHTSLGRTEGPFIGGDKVLSDVNEGKRCLDRHENVVSDMVSPLYWFFFMNGPTVLPREVWLYIFENGKN
jgi:hypothetical protein